MVFPQERRASNAEIQIEKLLSMARSEGVHQSQELATHSQSTADLAVKTHDALMEAHGKVLLLLSSCCC